MCSTHVPQFSVLIDVELVNEMLSHLVLCTEASTQLALRVRRDSESESDSDLIGEISLFLFERKSYFIAHIYL